MGAIHIQEGEITPDSTNNNNKQIVHVIIDAKREGIDFVRNCATTIENDSLELKDDGIHVPICQEDWRTIENNPNINSIITDPDADTKDVKDIKCKKDCDSADLENVLVTVNNQEGIENAQNCDMTRNRPDASSYVRSGGNTFIPISICFEDRDQLYQMNGIENVEVDNEVSIPGLNDDFSEENYENERDNNNDRDKTTVNENDQVSIPGLDDNFSEENYENERDNNNDRDKTTVNE